MPMSDRLYKQFVDFLLRGRSVAAATASAIALWLLATGVAAMAAPSSPETYCREIDTNAMPRPVPPSLVPAITAVFGVRMAPAEVQRQTVFRCAHGAVLACMTGANLNCGKADSSTTNAGADAWCRANRDAPFIPMFATGHATIYRWRCDGLREIAGPRVQAVDGQGFAAANWKRLFSR